MSLAPAIFSSVAANILLAKVQNGLENSFFHQIFLPVAHLNKFADINALSNSR